MHRALLSGKAIREKILEMVAPLSVEQMNHIPEGFNNNLAWQIGHLAVTPELLFYIRTGLQPERKVTSAHLYRIGTRPEAFIEAAEIKTLKSRMLTVLDDLQRELDSYGEQREIPVFTTTTFNIPTQTLGDAMMLSAHHDALHWGNMMALKKLV